jgi:hypothetical protein
VWLLLVVVACKHDDAPGADSGAAPAPSASASSSATSAKASVPTGPQVFAGSYTATAGTLFVPDAADWSHVKFRGDDAGALGEGTLTFTLDVDSGALSGDLQGPLGPATLGGLAADGTLSFHVSPHDATDMAFSGTGTGTLDDAGVAGEIHVSSWRANVLRDATFHAQRK